MTGWMHAPFGELVANVTERVDDPSSAGVERYVGLEHLDPGSLRIKRWGHPSDVEATKLRFEPGDIIFGKRRAYQRKLAQAAFPGICSAHAFVLRARPSVILPEFLPYLMRTDAFFERALAISVGSLSPTINWRTLALEQFAVPPLDQQRRLASLLSTETDVEEKLEDAIAHARTTRRSLAASFFQRALSSDEVVTLGELVTRCHYGLSVKGSDEGQVPMLGMANMVDGHMTDADASFVTLRPTDAAKYRLEHDDILFNRTNSIEHVGRVARYTLDGPHVFASYLVRLTADAARVKPRYLAEYLMSTEGQRRVRRYISRGVSQANINATNLKRVVVPVAPSSAQERLLSQLGAADDLIARLEERLSRAVELDRASLSELVSAHVH
jgi:type I restriction enzyme, S subunit